ncbi:MAG: polyribonucleotide nucleotidyltransferase [Epsilonproteobacteria bacterium]|nr:polyribonucleotide nucleotidyltransferase [Campylobacterota bacterium]
MSYKKIDLIVNDKRQVVELGKVARQANSAVWFQEGDTVILATLTYNKDEVIEEDFTPLVVQYVEKAYAVGKIPPGFVKREQKPGDFETLTARIVDRSIRPLFPKGYAYNTVVTAMVLSANSEADLQTAAMNASSLCLYLSDLPIHKIVYGCRLTRIDGEVILNPTLSELESGDFDMYVSGTQDELLMIEFKAQGQEQTQVIPIDDVLEPSEEVVSIYKTNELTEEEFIEILKIASDAISHATSVYYEAFKELKPQPITLELRDPKEDQELEKYIKDHYTQAILEALSNLAKSERASILNTLAKTIAQETDKEFDYVLNALNNIKREMVRESILKKGIRADGRGLRDIRDITIETNLLPSAHGSCLFTRGQTQALAIATLGGDMDAQMYANLTDKADKLERFMLHYNFPPFSVGEAERLGPPSRRELGHGNLAKRAIECLIDPSFEDTVRVVSEILESNGSSSMATVCASSLALSACKVPLKKLAAGVAMGLITEDEEYAILTDIMGLEDHDGDMDFKVTGTYDGITALQMDIKLGGIKLEILKEALDQAKEARFYILELMEQAKQQIRYNDKVLPKTINFQVIPDKIVDIIGQGGKVIKDIIAKFGVTIDLDRESGNVKVTGSNPKVVEDAKNFIISIVSVEDKTTPKVEVGSVVKGKVKRVANFGAFVEIAPGVEGLLHISKLSDQRVDRVEDIVNVGDEVEVKILSQKGFKIELALVRVLKD